MTTRPPPHSGPPAVPTVTKEMLRRLYLSMEGRITRKTYWLAILALDAVLLVGALFAVALPRVGVLIFTIALLAAIAPAIFVQGKRFQDRGKSAAWILIGLVPFVGGFWILIELGFLRGTVGPNQYGPDPLEGVTQTAAAGAMAGYGGNIRLGQSPVVVPAASPGPVAPESGFTCACGHANNSTDRFCRGCGTERGPAVSECASCGTTRSGGNRFCTGCGAAFVA